MFELRPLPWPEDAFEPVISKDTIRFHYHKHHAGYVDKLNALLGDKELSLEAVLKDFTEQPDIWNNAAQHFNHEFYWNSLSPRKSQAFGAVSDLITQKYGDFSSFQQAFIAKCVTLFGSGWVWLTWDESRDNIGIEQTSNAALPVHRPLLVLDVWEHAYYLDYQNRRKDHIEKVFEFIDWDQVDIRLANWKNK